MSMDLGSEQEAYDDVADYEDVNEADFDGDDDAFSDDEYDDTPIFSSNSGVDDFIGESSIVFDVEELVAQFEAESEAGRSPSARLRKRLEALAERKRRHAELMDFDDYELD